MAHFHIKKKKGRPYLYVREIARVDGKPKVVSQIYLGSPEKVATLAGGQAQKLSALKVEEYGALWLAREIDREIDLCSIVDAVVPREDREKGPSIGEYFLYCVLNRMVEAVSKNKLADWYKGTAIQQLRPVDLGELTSQRYWEKWDRVGEHALKAISDDFFRRVWGRQRPSADCLLFDTTNYYTFMSSRTDSDLSRRGKNKAGRHHLRQIGLGLLVARDSKLPLYWSVYPGNLHDSKHFEAVMDEMFGVACGLNNTKERLTVVIDKGMNSEGNFSWIDEHSRVHFVTTYSTYFSQDLAATPLDRFEIVDIDKNRRLIKENRRADCLQAYRTKGEYWGKERTAVVTYNPRTARKKRHTFESKLETIRRELLMMRAKVRDQAPHWRSADTVKERYLRLCERMHISSDHFLLRFGQSEQGLSMSFRKDPYKLKQKQTMFGKNIIVTDNMDWTTAEIVQASLDRWQVEDRFRLSNDDDLVGARPVRHWTDSKIRLHLFTCVVAMTYLRMLEERLRRAGIQRTASNVMADMRKLHSVLSLRQGARKLERRLETPSKTQAEVLKAFEYRIDNGGVLHPVTS
jgi:transposase